MHQPRPPLISNHQRKRLTLWALTALGWLAGVLFGERGLDLRRIKQRGHHLCLDELTRTVLTLIVARALQFTKVRTSRRVHPWKHGRCLRRAHFIRSLLGARLRRQLWHKDFNTRIAQLIALLRNLDMHARRLAQRLRKLRRLWRLAPPIAPAALILGAPAPSPALRNTS